MPDLLLELRCEEIPARMQAGARASMGKLFREQMLVAGVSHGDLTVWSTPRRLALIARDLPDATQAVREEVKGPKTTAPEQALAGFLRKTGLAREQLEDRGGTWFAVSEKPGRATAEVLAEAIPAIVRAFPWPKSMRWGEASLSTESLRWVRPLSGIVAILGEELVPCKVGEVSSAYATLGHRFHHPGEITIGGAGDYQEKLRACHVVVDHAEREALIRTRAAAAAAETGLALVADEGLVIENAGLTEWPVPLLGRFDEAFLDVPPEVIQLTARTNQKYFVCNDGTGRLANAFVCTANIEAADGGEAILAGNRKVLAARLSDARFFWEQDRRRTLAEHAEGLARITFHAKLGTVADKVERVAKLARWLVEEGIVKLSLPQPRSARPEPGEGPSFPSASENGASTSSARTVEGLAELAEQAARLCKADLTTGMVGEFPELQGLMGGYYARAEGLPDEVADAIRDHYKPVGQGDEVPTAPVTVAVSLADKLDTIVGFFGVKERPTGSKDPFALRRAALGIIQLIFANKIRIGLQDISARSALRFIDGHFYRDMQDEEEDAAKGWLEDFAPGQLSTIDVPAFFADRLKVQQRERGVRHDLIDAVFALGGEDDLVRLLNRVEALQAFIASDDGANLHTAYKRAANILKKENWTPGATAGENEGAQGEGIAPPTGEEDPLVLVDDPEFRDIAAEFTHPQGVKTLSYSPEPAESALIEALDAAEPRARAAVEAEDFGAAMAALASLRGPIDAFFDHVTVNDPDPARRAARLDLLARFRDAVHEAADFSKIEG